jgi:hypothetical protein
LKFRGEPYLPSSDVIVHPARKVNKPVSNPTPTTIDNYWYR